MRAACVGGALAATILAPLATAALLTEGANVHLVNRTERTLCAEEDNVYLELRAPVVQAFRVEASHPAYLPHAPFDRTEPDFTNCDMAEEAARGEGEPERIILHQSAEWSLVGIRLDEFWRKQSAPLRISGREWPGLHLVQLWKRHATGEDEEVAVVYPADGYWRLRPLAPAGRSWTAYGSSVLIGPVETEGRPIVSLREIVFDPATLTFALSFGRGGSGTVRLARADRDGAALDVELQIPEQAGRPFAALRSMWVADDNADASHVGWRRPGDGAWLEQPIMDFAAAPVAEAWIGRRAPSVHNTSAPDIRFGAFRVPHTPR